MNIETETNTSSRTFLFHFRDFGCGAGQLEINPLDRCFGIRPGQWTLNGFQQLNESINRVIFVIIFLLRSHLKFDEFFAQVNLCQFLPKKKMFSVRRWHFGKKRETHAAQLFRGVKIACSGLFQLFVFCSDSKVNDMKHKSLWMTTTTSTYIWIGIFVVAFPVRKFDLI